MKMFVSSPSPVHPSVLTSQAFIHSERVAIASQLKRIIPVYAFKIWPIEELFHEVPADH